jgi:glutathione synthase/RimK-type ligase-like ATP-grasp enzyme
MYNLAILYDDAEILKPSNSEFIEYLINIASLRHIHCTLIKERHLDILHQFDGLFIRVTTRRDHYTLEFAEHALRHAVKVLDHPADIWNCTSKIIQRQLFIKHKIEYPITRIISAWDNHGFQLPAIVKTPDGCFSQGVYRINNRVEFNRVITPLFKRYPYLLIQEYLRTKFDWRIGVLQGQPLFAIKYFILPGDFRIVSPGKECDHENVALQDVPHNVLDLALRAAAVIGDGLYGVDIKDHWGDLFVLEVNDNPSIDRYIEDVSEGDSIYHKILDFFYKE